MGSLELKHMRMIRAIAETENMTKAARLLCISQSALSQQLKDIEGKLAVDLFFRTPRKMIPTPMGSRLLGTARQVIDTVDEVELEIARAVSGETGELKVGTQCVFCYKWLPLVMKRFQIQFPGIDVEIGNSSQPIRELLAKTFDIIIAAAPHNDDQCMVTPLFDDHLVCIMPSDHPLAAAPFVRLQDFARYKLISHAEKEGNRFYQSMLKPRGIEPQRLMTVGSPQAIVSLVAAGFGISVFPAWATRSSRDAGIICMRSITKHGVPLTWKALYLKTGSRPAFQDEFIRIVGKLNVADIKTLPDCPPVAA
jgi:LysR family transcriptional regulator for metE and metH